ncbi:MAG TPA: hypothetical protein VJA94_04790 [Candidatus Angelobacter sp.]
MLKLIWRLMLAAVVVLLATSLFAASASHDKAAIKTQLQPDLSLKTALLPDLRPDAVVAGTLKTCRCSCGIPCTTNADCGGNVCAVGITCCASGRGDGAMNQIFEERESLSSRQTPSLVRTSVNCKQK